MRYFRADLDDLGSPVASNHGRFEPGGNLEDMIGRRLPAEAFQSLSFPAVYDEVILLAHPWVAPTFTSSVNPDWSSQQIGEHVVEIVQRVVGKPADWVVRYEFVGSDSGFGKRSDRILVTCFPPAIEHIGRRMGVQRFVTKSTLAVIGGWVSSQEVAARPPVQVTVGIGHYAGRLEISLHRHGTLRLATYVRRETFAASTAAVDRLLDSMGVAGDDISRVVLYGHRFDESALGASRMLANVDCEWLSPSDMFESTARDVTVETIFGVVAAGALGRLLFNV